MRIDKTCMRGSNIGRLLGDIVHTRYELLMQPFLPIYPTTILSSNYLELCVELTSVYMLFPN